jgi:tetratricopeptide (TPR) repeat protein
MHSRDGRSDDGPQRKILGGIVPPLAVAVALARLATPAHPAQPLHNGPQEPVMPMMRHLQTSLALVVLCAPFAWAQEGASVQKLLERGSLEEALERAEGDRGNPESTFLAAQAAGKLNNPGRAVEEYSRLQETGDDSWRAIGESGAKLLRGDLDGAREAANRAVEANGENAYAHYQLGAVASRQNDFARAAEAFERSVQLKPDLAYAHYYAGLANQRLKRTAKMSEHLEMFMRLAPEAPERSAVSAILRTLRGR